MIKKTIITMLLALCVLAPAMADLYDPYISTGAGVEGAIRTDWTFSAFDWQLATTFSLKIGGYPVCPWRESSSGRHPRVRIEIL